jgi:hypothetical protein
VNALARHIADAIAETAEEHLPKLDQTAYFHVKKALESTADHVVAALNICYDDPNMHLGRDGTGLVDIKEFLAACCIGRHK